MTKYTFRQNARITGVDPQKAGERLEQLRRKSAGLLDPQSVVDDARPSKAPTHGAFEWDDTEAAAQHRRWQARELLGALVVHVNVTQGEPPQPVRAFPNVIVEAGQGYSSHASAMNDVEQREYLVAQALAEAQAWSARHGQLQELDAIHSAVVEVSRSRKSKVRAVANP